MEQPAEHQVHEGLLPWDASVGSLPSSFLTYLTGEDLMLQGPRDPSLDAGTLAAAAAAQGALPQPAPRKRVKREGSENAGGGDAGSNEDDLSDDDEDCEDLPGEGGRAGRPGGKRKSATAAANKASREKARREKINDRFTELAKLVDPGAEPKSDKLSILGEAIRFVQQVHVENCQVKQLNKFLEEKVGQLEKERAQMLYQMYQMTGGQMMAPAAAPAAAAGMMAQQGMLMPGLAGASAAAVAPAPALPPHVPVMQQQLLPGAAGCAAMQQQHQPLAQQGLGQQVLGAPASGADAAQQQQQVDVPPPPQQQQHALLDAQQQAPPPQQQQQLLAHGKALMPAVPQAGPGGMPPMPYWSSMMPAGMLDSRQDSLLRPPAA